MAIFKELRSFKKYSRSDILTCQKTIPLSFRTTFSNRRVRIRRGAPPIGWTRNLEPKQATHQTLRISLVDITSYDCSLPHTATTAPPPSQSVGQLSGVVMPRVISDNIRGYEGPFLRTAPHLMIPVKSENHLANTRS
jgi:hypothetical protein